MKTEMLLWMAGKLGLNSPFIRTQMMTCSEVCYCDMHGNEIVIDLEADTPESAWLREKVVEWLGTTHHIFFEWNVLHEAWQAWGVAPREYPSYKESVLAAVQWTYDHREVE